jgi:hypothetical protein
MVRNEGFKLIPKYEALYHLGSSTSYIAQYGPTIMHKSLMVLNLEFDG